MAGLKKRILRAEALRLALCWIIACYVRFVYRTGRWRIEGDATPERFHREGKPFILAFWHGRLLMMPMIWRRDKPIHMLISDHGDGRIIADAVRHFGIKSIAGSSGKGGLQALRAMVRTLRSGDCVGITPDGPRGPAMQASEGIVATARLARIPIIPASYASRRRYILGSWDHFHFALPFSEGLFLWGKPIAVPADADDAALEFWRLAVEDSLNDLTRTAERRMGHDEKAAMGPRHSLALSAYGLLATALGPLIRLYLYRRQRRGKEDSARIGERLGRASLKRPEGPLVWLHAASIGEAVSALALIERLRAERPGLAILVTTGTVTSARLMAERLPPGPVFHQFVPVDRPAYVRRFLDHWQPDLGLWIESEMWPILVTETQKRGIPTILLNGRISAASFSRWRKWRGLIGPMLSGFDLCLAQDEVQAERLRRLGAVGPRAEGDLKAGAAALPIDEAERARLEAAIGSRPVWLAASTHAGEEEIAAEVHLRLKALHPGLLTLIAPRHPVRAEKIAQTLAVKGLVVTRRAESEPITPETDIYLADTLGELGLFYRLGRIAFVGGSLTPVGGHNPVEPALLDCAILHGPDMTNCAGMAKALDDAGAAEIVASAEELADAVSRLLSDPTERNRRANAAAQIAASDGKVLDRILHILSPWLDRAEHQPENPPCALPPSGPSPV